MFLLVVALCALTLLTSAFPEFERCNLETWIGGGQFGQFGIDTYTDGGAENCVIQGVPELFQPCETLVISLTSRLDLGHKLAVSAGALSNGLITTTKQKPECRHSSRIKLKVTNYRWTAPADATNVSFGGLCGDMRTNPVVFAAQQQIAIRAANGSVFPTGCPLDANAEEEEPPPSAADQISGNIPLIAGIGGAVVAGLGLAGFFAFQHKSKKAQKVLETIQDVGDVAKQRIQSMRPAPGPSGLQIINQPYTLTPAAAQQGYAYNQSPSTYLSASQQQMMIAEQNAASYTRPQGRQMWQEQGGYPNQGNAGRLQGSLWGSPQPGMPINYASSNPAYREY